MKILFVSRTRSDRKNALNHRLMMLQRGLQRLGLRADCLFLGDWIRTEPPILSPLQFSTILPKLREYDVIHAGTALSGFALCLHRRKFGAVLIHDMHGDGAGEMRMKLRHENGKLRSLLQVLQASLLEEVAIHRADWHLVVSRPLKRMLLGHGVPGDKILLLRNGVDIELFKPKGGPPDGPFTVCYAGEFQVWQGVDLLMEAIDLISESDLRFTLVGFRSTPGDNRCKARLRRLPGSRVRLVDRVPQKDLIELLRGADLLVLPRPYHRATAVAMPTKFAEYLALGKAVLVTEVDETARFVRRSRCGLVSPPTAKGLADAIIQARRMGREELTKMGKRGRRLAEEVFGWDVICDRYVHFLREIMDSQRV